MLAGPPCETWSRALHTSDGPTDGRPTPRPLRHPSTPWATSRRSSRERRVDDGELAFTGTPAP
eukprot:8952613-Prorocentrum_lima.AAC.1